jgi:hypothetical protein
LSFSIKINLVWRAIDNRRYRPHGHPCGGKHECLPYGPRGHPFGGRLIIAPTVGMCPKPYISRGMSFKDKKYNRSEATRNYSLFIINYSLKNSFTANRETVFDVLFYAAS